VNVTDRDDDRTVARCDRCGYHRVFPRILSTVEVMRLRCHCKAAA
jgi:hypothetical protein